jgi:hypothetical protein
MQVFPLRALDFVSLLQIPSAQPAMLFDPSGQVPKA